MKEKLLFVLLLCLMSGCAWFGVKSGGRLSKQKKAPSQFVQKGKVLDAKRLNDGGNLLIVPFNAGAAVAATDELDRISLMIVKGISLALMEGHSALKVLNADSADMADMAIKGRIVTKEVPGRFTKWVLRKKTRRLGVEGTLVDLKGGKTILRFSHYRETQHNGQSFGQMGAAIGEDIGRFILSGMEGGREE